MPGPERCPSRASRTLDAKEPMGGPCWLRDREVALGKQIGGSATEKVFHVGSGCLALDEHRVRHDCAMQWNRGFDSANQVFAERPISALEGNFSGGAVADEFAN